MRYKKVFVGLVLALAMGAMWMCCHSFFNQKASVGMALNRAGSNRKELEKVLARYREHPADSLKYKAACFLIENMPYYSYPESSRLEDYKQYFAWLKKSSLSPDILSDSIRKRYGELKRSEFVYRQDIMKVDSAYLCHNIDWAFKVWEEQPWGKNVSFNTFCEYVLPYRIGDEALVYWREMYYHAYNPLLNDLRASDSLDKEDPLIAAKFLFDRLPDRTFRYTGVTPAVFGHVGPVYVQYLSGSCLEVTDFTIYMFRALGIPCTMDFTPMRGQTHAGHSWMACWDKNGETYMSEFPKSPMLVRKNIWCTKEDNAKVYRQTFSLNRRVYGEMAQYKEELYPLWRLPNFVDVTPLYARYYMEKLEIPRSCLYEDSLRGKSIVYLCHSARKNWASVDWAKVDERQLLFRRIKKGATMCLGIYEGEEIRPVSAPFYVDKQTDEVHFYICGKEKEEVTLYNKYGADQEELWLRENMLGGVFEGSNAADFAMKDTLFIIHRTPERLFTEVCSWQDKEYRYVRYVGNKGTYCGVAEIALYAPGDSLPMRGKNIGPSDDSPENVNRGYEKAFDGKSWTSFEYSKETGGWTGLDFGKPMRVERIIYTPVNRDNGIRYGDEYELFYCDGGWKSLGIKRATSDSLVYKNVPEGALLILCNHTRGVQERIFTYENGIQKWK